MGCLRCRTNQARPEALILEFDSAWSPPIRGLNSIAGLFPELEFYIEFEEPMSGFRGFAHWIREEKIEEHCEDWYPFEEDEKSLNPLIYLSSKMKK